MTIVPIRPGLEPPSEVNEPNPDAIAKIEALLAEARAGEVTGIAYAASHPGGLTSFGDGGRTTRIMIRALVMLQHWMCKNDIENG